MYSLEPNGQRAKRKLLHHPTVKARCFRPTHVHATRLPRSPAPCPTMQQPVFLSTFPPVTLSAKQIHTFHYFLSFCLLAPGRGGSLETKNALFSLPALLLRCLGWTQTEYGQRQRVRPTGHTFVDPVFGFLRVSEALRRITVLRRCAKRDVLIVCYSAMVNSPCFFGGNSFPSGIREGPRSCLIQTSFRISNRGCAQSALYCPSRGSCRVQEQLPQSGGRRPRGGCPRLPVPP